VRDARWNNINRSKKTSKKGKKTKRKRRKGEVFFFVTCKTAIVFGVSSSALILLTAKTNENLF
jgi:hypothetical protein